MSIRYMKRKDSDGGSDDELQIVKADQRSSYQGSDISISISEDRINNYGDSVNEAYLHVEGQNYFTPYYAFMLGMSAYATGLACAMPFLIKIPDLMCSYDNESTWNKGSVDDACVGNNLVSFKYDQHSFETVENWVTKFNMVGNSELPTALFGALYFVGFVIGSLCILTLGDIFGRKPVLLWSTIVSILIYYFLFNSDGLYFVYVSLVFVGAVSIAKFAIAYIYMLELIHTSKHIFYHGLINISGVIFAISLIPFFMYVKNGLFVFLMFIVMSALSLIPIYMTPESPQFLYSKERYEEAHEALRYIAKVNKAEPWDMKFSAENTHNISGRLSKMSMSLGFFESLRNEIFRHNLVIMVINWCACSLGYYIIGFFLNDFPGSSYINMLAMQVAELISFLLASIYFEYFGINHGFSVANVIVVVFSLLYLISGTHVAIGYMGVFMMRFGVSMGFGLSYYATAEIFDVNLKSRAFAIGNIISRGVTISAPLLTELISYPIIVVLGISLLSGIVSQFIVKKETEEEFEDAKTKAS